MLYTNQRASYDSLYLQDFHNMLRERHTDTPSLCTSEGLRANAQEYANTLRDMNLADPEGTRYSLDHDPNLSIEGRSRYHRDHIT